MVFQTGGESGGTGNGSSGGTGNGSNSGITLLSSASAQTIQD